MEANFEQLWVNFWPIWAKKMANFEQFLANFRQSLDKLLIKALFCLKTSLLSFVFQFLMKCFIVHIFHIWGHLSFLFTHIHTQIINRGRESLQFVGYKKSLLKNQAMFFRGQIFFCLLFSFLLLTNHKHK